MGDEWRTYDDRTLDSFDTDTLRAHAERMLLTVDGAGKEYKRRVLHALLRRLDAAVECERVIPEDVTDAPPA